MPQDSPHDSSPDIWWAIPDVLAGMSMPFIHPERHETLGAALRDFPDELPALWDAGIRGIVCLLNMPSINQTYSAAGFASLLLPMNNGAAPTKEQFQKFLTFVASQRALSHPIAVHCEAGIGRTGVLLAGYLVASGFTPEHAIDHVRSKRRGAVETQSQVEFLYDIHGWNPLGPSAP